MVEVFKTNIQDPCESEVIAKAIRERFPEYQLSFDLEDCDKILRVANAKPDLEYQTLFNIARSLGVKMEVLPDLPAFSPLSGCVNDQ
jgi:hypothetical protein